jgi:hypothetical protein
LAGELGDALDSPTVSTDEFATEGVLTPSDDWNGIDRARLVAQVLAPFRRGERRISYASSGDWEAFTAATKTLEVTGDHLIVEGVGLFHPDVLPYLDVTVWIDSGLRDSSRRGRARDARAGQADDALWAEVWIPNDRRFADRFDPRAHADVVLAPAR